MTISSSSFSLLLTPLLVLWMLVVHSQTSPPPSPPEPEKRGIGETEKRGRQITDSPPSTRGPFTISGRNGGEFDTVFNKNRIKWIAVAGGALYSATLFGLNELWYKNSPRSRFHFFNDNREWLQVDKVGHFYSAFHLSRIGVDIVQWTATTESPLTTHHSPTWLGCTAGFLAMTPIEILDGFSAQHGASWGDLIANAAGSGLALGQYLLWNELRIYPKYSFHQTRFAPIRPNLLGENLLQQSLKDYNGQTYWLSVNIASFLNNDTKLPPWLNVSFGYGAYGMLGGFENVWYQENKEIDYTDIQRYRQYYLSLDIDWMRIKTNRKFLKSLFYILNAFQIPVPALEFNAGRIADPAKKRLTLQLIYFTI